MFSVCIVKASRLSTHVLLELYSSMVTLKSLPKLTATSVRVEHETLSIIDNGFSKGHSYASRTHDFLSERERSIGNEGKTSENDEFIRNSSTYVHVVAHNF